MLSKQYRLQRTNDIKAVLRKGFGLKQGPLSLKALKNNSAKIRFAFIISKKVASKASERNRLKRLMSEAARKRLPDLKPGVDAVLIALAGAGDRQTLDELDRTLSNLVKKAGLSN